jgi:hypothetical protein
VCKPSAVSQDQKAERLELSALFQEGQYLCNPLYVLSEVNSPYLFAAQERIFNDERAPAQWIMLAVSGFGGKGLEQLVGSSLINDARWQL